MTGRSNGLIPRALGAALLDVPTYEAVEADGTALLSMTAVIAVMVAFAVVVGVSVGVGTLITG